MYERLKIIKEYYINLEYNENNRKKALMEISALSNGIKFKDVNDFSDRFLETARLIENNIFLFKSVCEHVDITTTIIKYLTNFGMKFMLGCKFEEEYEKNEVVLLVMLTIFNICREHELLMFLENVIIKNSILDETSCYEHLKYECLNQTNEMILLEDADLYAVISYLRTKEPILLSLNKIWVQEPIKQKLICFIKKYFEKYFEYLNISIHAFRSKQELFTASASNKIYIVSIWSEDITAAKNLAISLNCDILFINAHMDLYDGIVLLPYTKIFDKTLHKWYKSSLDNYTTKSNVYESSIYNLFYDGIWQQPVKSTYWIYNDHLWANATSNDIRRCIDSAEKGFKVWSTKCITSRMQILSKFASILKCSGKSQLANIILKCIKFPYIYENSLLSQSGRLEVTKIRKPRGVIILKEENETILFCLLMQILIAGNSVIVICNANFYSLAPYCDIFSTSEISPGVINLLSNENIKDLELGLCAMDYANYAERFFSEDNPEKTYINLTIPKQIILHLK